MKRTVALIIPTLYTKRPGMVRRAILSVLSAATQDISVSVIVVVNCAPKDVTEKALGRAITGQIPAPAHVLCSGMNKGFAQAVNDGILYAKASTHPDWYLVLNDDAVMHGGFFVRLKPYLAEKRYDAISCKILTSTGSIESVGLRYLASGLAFPRHRDIRPEEQVTFAGACVLLSRYRVDNELARCGYVFHPLFFAYAEDVELSLRIQRDGGNMIIVNDALVTHEGSHTAGRGSFFQLYYGYRNLLLTILLHWSGRDMLRRLPQILIGQGYVLAMSLYKGYFLLYPKMLRWVIMHFRIILWQRNRYAQG